MKGSKILSAVFGVLGILLMVATAAVSIASRNAQPRMLESPEAASAQAQRMMDAPCASGTMPLPKAAFTVSRILVRESRRMP